MVEIGPGQGAMTKRLLESLKQLQVVELDRDLVALLQKKFSADKLAIHSGDALQFDFAQLRKDDRKLRIVGNLPYNISSPLLFHLAQYAPQVIDQHFMLQKEVVERMVAEPGSRDYGRLSVMLQWRYRMELLFIVPPGAFDPPPKVDSAIVRMVPIASPLECEQRKLEQVVTKAFSQRRKVIRNCVAGMFTEALLDRMGMSDFFDVIVSGDTTAHKKPHPEPILHACRIFGVAPGRNLHVGDSKNDIQSARAAGCPCYCVPYGYNEGEPVDSADCDALVSDLLAAYRLASDDKTS
jgi:16S rRNA (adenine1518-N6/adenine1519-N6)-dimethyltransferase